MEGKEDKGGRRRGADVWSTKAEMISETEYKEVGRRDC